MGRHCVLRNVEEARHLSSRDPIRLMHHNQLERIHAGWLGKSRKSFDVFSFSYIWIYRCIWECQVRIVSSKARTNGYILAFSDSLEVGEKAKCLHTWTAEVLSVRAPAASAHYEPVT